MIQGFRDEVEFFSRRQFYMTKIFDKPQTIFSKIPLHRILGNADQSARGRLKVCPSQIGNQSHYYDFTRGKCRIESLSVVVSPVVQVLDGVIIPYLLPISGNKTDVVKSHGPFISNGINKFRPVRTAHRR